MNAYRRFCDWLGIEFLSERLAMLQFFKRREPDKAIDVSKRIARNRKKLEAQGWRAGQWRWRVSEGGRANVTPMRKAK